ncbi:MAG TPA: hypothetical protein VN704_11130 [Verrucomicrobiae bacterium]|nr:hypothetical protein [Verrucomicrobiae bacterium]
MLIRLEQSFLKTVSQLNEPFSEAEKKTLSAIIESKYDAIITNIKEQENQKTKSSPKIIELGNIGHRSFGLSLYYMEDSENDDIPLSVTQLLPTISPVRIDIMTTLQKQQQHQHHSQQSKDIDSSYLKAGQVYDDGDINSKFIDKMIEGNEGRRSTL